MPTTMQNAAASSATTAAPAKPPGERTFLTNAQKLQLRAFWAANAQLPVQDVADWVRRRFGASVGRATLYRIGRAPASAFEGQRGSRKKPRRVKFPALERDVLAFCLACKQQRRALPDDLLLQQAAQLRARHGIGSDELKLSNGWLYSFKERHSLRAAVHAAGESSGGPPPSGAVPASVEDPSSPADAPALASRRRKQRASIPSLTLPPPLLIATSTTPLTDKQPPQEPSVPRGVAPLTYISVKALSSVQAASFINWERVGGMRDGDLFAVVDDGICVRRGGRYQINADINYSASAPAPASAGTSAAAAIVFKVWKDASELLGESSACLQQENGVSLSAFQLQASLPADSVVRIQFITPGFALHSSRLVIKLVASASGAVNPSLTTRVR